MYFREYTSGFSEPAASHLAASPSPRHEGNVGQALRGPMIRGSLDEKRMREGGTASNDRSETGYRITRLPTHSYHCCRDTGSVTVQPRSHEWEASVTAVDSLMLDAKQAIMDEHHRRFQTFYQEGRWEEALQEIHVTLSCATDLLNESLRVLDEALETHNHPPAEDSIPPPAAS